jgi:hypothetical protein
MASSILLMSILPTGASLPNLTVWFHFDMPWKVRTRRDTCPAADEVVVTIPAAPLSTDAAAIAKRCARTGVTFAGEISSRWLALRKP